MRPAPARPAPPASPLKIAGAGLLAALLFALLLLSATPAAHAWLHQAHATADTHACSASASGHAPHRPDPASSAAHPEAECAITLLAQGLLAASPAPVATPPRPEFRAVTFTLPATPGLAPVPHARPASQAPPASRVTA